MPSKYRPSDQLMNRITRYAKAAKYAGKMYKSYRKRKYSKNNIVSNPTTSQHEYATVYKKKRMPKGKRKAWKRFVRKTTAVSMKNLPLQTYVYSENNNIYAAANFTGYYYCGLYGLNGSARVLGTATSSGTGAVNQINTLFTQNFVPVTGKQILCESACMDYTLRNLTANTAIIEMYYVIPKRDIDDQEFATKFRVEDIYTESFQTAEIGTNIGSITAATLGTTPFNAPYFTRHFTITKKLRVQLGGNEIYSGQIRNPKNYKINYSDVQKYAMKKGMASGIFFQIYGQPQIGLLAANATDAASVKIEVFQTHNWRPVTPFSTGVSA